jgi:hypothetical protein
MLLIYVTDYAVLLLVADLRMREGMLLSYMPGIGGFRVTVHRLPAFQVHHRPVRLPASVWCNLHKHQQHHTNATIQCPN